MVVNCRDQAKKLAFNITSVQDDRLKSNGQNRMVSLIVRPIVVRIKSSIETVIRIYRRKSSFVQILFGLPPY